MQSKSKMIYIIIIAISLFNSLKGSGPNSECSNECDNYLGRTEDCSRRLHYRCDNGKKQCCMYNSESDPQAQTAQPSTGRYSEANKIAGHDIDRLQATMNTYGTYQLLI